MAGGTESLMKKIVIDSLTKIFSGRSGDIVALDNVSLDIEENEFICIVGPSGCGKSTMLNIIAGLEKPSSGEVLMDGRKISGPGPERGVIFQQYALFAWLTVEKNVEYGLMIKKVPRPERKKIVKKYIEIVGLSDFSKAYPKELSGGMKQRVAIARAYANNPEILLLDEPFGALDAQTRSQLQEDLLNTWESEKKTCFFITHDVEEAVLLSQRIVIMSSRPGRIKEIVKVAISYPRNQKTKLTKEFNDTKNYIWEQVYQEYLTQRK